MENPATALAKSEEKKPIEKPIFVEAEKMFERFAQTSREIASRAFDFFQERGREWGTQLDDWFRAESEILRPAPVDITETPESINVRLAVPGFKPDEIELSVKDDQLFMSGETSLEEEKEDEKTFYSEWKSNRFCRQFTLPSNVDPDSVNAELKDGILRITLQKIAPKEPSKIEVKPA
jgi:HSP20 family protein